MRLKTIILLGALGAVAACGGSRAPATDEDDVLARTEDSNRRGLLSRAFGFGRDRGPSTPAEQPLVQRVLRVELERLPGGAILKATGLPPTQGHFDANLTLIEGEGDRVLTYAFRLTPPTAPQRVSTQASREVVAGLFISSQDLAGVREVRVVGAENSQGRRPR